MSERDAIPREAADVAVVGGGPAGLAAAAQIRRAGAARVVVLEREAEPGGIPRHAKHQGFGLRDLHRAMSGPRYAARLAERRGPGRRRAADRGAGDRLGRPTGRSS